MKAKDPLVEEAMDFGFGSETGIDIPGEASGRIADRRWKLDYWKQMKSYYCGIAGKPQDGRTSDFVYLFAQEFCVEGYAYRAGDAVNFAIGQGDTIVTPLQLARAYGAIANGGTLYAPRIAKAIVSPDGTVLKRFAPKKVGTVDVPDSVLGYIDTALKGVSLRGTMNWRLLEFPLEQVQIRSKTGSAEVYGKQSTSWVASYTDDYVVVMMVSQGGTGSGTSGPAVRAIYEALYGIEGMDVDGDRAAIPGVVAPDTLPSFERNGAILPPGERRPEVNVRTSRPSTTLRVPGLDWILMAAVAGLLVIGTLLVWSATSARVDLTGGDTGAYLRKQLVNIAIGLVLLVMVLATDHRWVRILAPLVYLASVGGLVLVLTNGVTINGSRSWIQLGGMSIQPAEFAKLAVVIGMALVVAERAEGRQRRTVGWIDVTLMLLIAGVPAALILLQPDLGTMLVLSATVFGVLAASGAPRRWLLLLAGSGAAVAVLAVWMGMLEDYQVDRFLAFTNPDLDPRGAGYNTEQARIAVGNGGLFGEGLFSGSQTRPASCRSSTPTSCSPSPARSSAWSAPAS